MSPIDQVWLLAFVVSPALAVTIGYIAVRLHERDSRRRHQLRPGE